jgi:hypothetical protein
MVLQYFRNPVRLVSGALIFKGPLLAVASPRPVYVSISRQGAFNAGVEDPAPVGAGRVLALHEDRGLSVSAREPPLHFSSAWMASFSARRVSFAGATTNTFRATEITACLQNGGTFKKGQQIFRGRSGNVIRYQGDLPWSNSRKQEELEKST